MIYQIVIPYHWYINWECIAQKDYFSKVPLYFTTVTFYPMNVTVSKKCDLIVNIFFHKFYSLQLWLHVKSANLYLTITTSYFTNDKFISHIWLVKCGFIFNNYNLISHKYDLICQNCSFISQNYEYMAQPDYFPLLYI